MQESSFLLNGKTNLKKLNKKIPAQIMNFSNNKEMLLQVE